MNTLDEHQKPHVISTPSQELCFKPVLATGLKPKKSCGGFSQINDVSPVINDVSPDIGN
jgi:hypothetical protein